MNRSREEREVLTAADKPQRQNDTKLRRTQAERRALARACLIESAIALILKDGFARTTMAGIAQRAGLTRGAIQHHFSGRVELITEIISEVERRVIESFTAAASGDASLETRIDVLIDGLAEVSLSAQYMAAMDIWLTSRSDPDLLDVVRNSVARYSNHFRELWRSTFGDTLPESLITECRLMMVAVSRGVILSRLITGDCRPRTSSVTLQTTKKLLKAHLLSFTEQNKGRSRVRVAESIDGRPHRKPGTWPR